MKNLKTLSIEELIHTAKTSDPQLLEALKTAATPAEFVAAARALGYDVTEREIRAHKPGRKAEFLTEQDLSRVAGGMPPVRTTASWTFGVSCCWC